MRQNAPNPISISIFPGVTRPDPRHWGLCPQTPGEGREGWEGREGKGRGGKGEGGEERGGEVCVIAVGGINAVVKVRGPGAQPPAPI